jgi:hypothetical protein
MPLFPFHTVFGVVGDKAVLDGKHVGVHDGGVLEVEPHVVAELAELLVVRLGGPVDAGEAAVRVVLALLLHHQCRQAPQGAGAVDPELPRAIVVENLKSPPRDAFLSVYAD